ILEALQDIPESHVSLKIADVPMEILQVQDRRIRRVLLQKPSSDLAANHPNQPGTVGSERGPDRDPE
ncbi:MAG: hypothetical protein ACO3TO_03430, partial [Burkholderiaceae bacterium]